MKQNKTKTQTKMRKQKSITTQKQTKTKKKNNEKNHQDGFLARGKRQKSGKLQKSTKCG